MSNEIKKVTYYSYDKIVEVIWEDENRKPFIATDVFFRDILKLIDSEEGKNE